MTRAPWGIGAAAFVMYVVLGSPSTTWYDGGELALAASTLGVAHPPGEPAYLVLAALAALIPVGDVSFRLTLLSATTVAGSVAVVTILAERLSSALGVSPGAATWAGIAAGVTLAVCPLVALQAVRPELYGLTLLGGLLGVLGLSVGGRRGVALAVLPLAVIGAVHHAILVAALPALALAALLRGRRAFSAGLITAAALVLPALGQFAWLPIRSFTNPPIDFGTPRTLGRIIWSVTGSGYARSFTGIDLSIVRSNLLGHAELFAQGFGAAGLTLTALGFLVLARQHWRWAGVALTLAACGVAPTALQGLFDVTNPDAAGYLVGVAALLASLSGLGIAVVIDLLAKVIQGTGVARLVSIGLVLSAAAQPVMRTVATVDSSDLTGPSRFANAVLDSAPRGAVVLLSGDAWVFPALLARYREGRRPDVHVLGLHMLERDALAGLRARGLPIPEPFPEVTIQAVRAIGQGGCCGPELLVSGLVAAGVPVAVNEAFLAPAELDRRWPRGLLYDLGMPYRWAEASADIDSAVQAEDRLHADFVGRVASERGRDRVLEGLLGRRYMARAGFFRSEGLERLASVALSRGSAASRDPWAMVHLHRFRLESAEAPIAPSDGSGRIPDGPWVTSVDPIKAVTTALAGAPADDLRALRGTLRLMHDDVPGAHDDISAVLRTRPDHPTALLAAERLFSLGRPVVLSARATP